MTTYTFAPTAAHLVREGDMVLAPVKLLNGDGFQALTIGQVFRNRFGVVDLHFTNGECHTYGNADPIMLCTDC